MMEGEEQLLIRLGFDIQFELPAPVAMIALFHVHPSRRADLREPDDPQIIPNVPIEEYEDSFGNICTRFTAPAGMLQLYHSTLIEDSGAPDALNIDARQLPVENLPPEALRYLLASRYCEVDRLPERSAECSSATRNRDGRAFRRSAIGCSRTLRSATISPIRRKRLSMFLGIAWVSAAIFSISRSHFVAV